MQGSGEYTFPASSAQEWIWLASQIGTGSAAYNLRGYALLPARVDADVVRAALAELVRRHEPLRTALRLRDGAPTQVVHTEVPVDLAHLDVAALPRPEAVRRAREVEAADLAEPFALDRAPLWRARLVHLPEQSRLLFVAHHAIFDGNSVPILAAEMRELCEAAVEGRRARLPELEIQYADYAAWQAERLRTGAGDVDLAYWRDRLAGAPVVHGVPIDHSRTAGPGRPGAELLFDLPEELRTELGALGRRHSASPAMILLAGYVALLYRLSGDATVLVGLPVAGRDRPELAPLIGMFVNTLVLRVDTSGDPGFGELVERVRDTMLAAFEHQELPLPRLVEALSPPRTPGVQPLYQLGFNYLGKVELSTSNGSAHEELLLEVNETAGRLEYRRDLFDAGTAERLVRRYLCLLRAALAAPDARLSALPLLDEAEQLLLAGWSTGGPADPPGGTVVDLIRARAAERPAAVALHDGATSITYAELERRAGRLAARLRAAGVGPEQLVGLALPRSADVVVAMLAVLRSGAAYVPLDPASPAQRLAYLVEDAAASVVVTATGLRSALPPGPYTVLCLDDPDPAGADGPGLAGADDADPAAPAPGDLAYVIHTSGSTGRPKGAMIEHRSLAAHAVWFARRLDVTPADRLLVLASPSFDVFGQEVYPALVAGATLVIAPPAGALDAPALLETVRRAEVTLLSCVPTVLKHLVAEPGLADCRSLRRVTCIGEQLTGDLAADLAAVLPVPLHNLYGPTETTIAVSAHTAPPGERVAGPVPIGGPMPGCTLHVLDERGEPVPVGVPGHLHIGGVPVGRGYLGRPAETAAAFVPDPFGPPGLRLYRTGDRCRWRHDGTLEFLERLDRQVKVNGLRVELGEIETALRAQPGVREAAVVVHADPHGQRLVGYVVGDADPDALRPALRAILPAALVPAAVVGLPALPTLPSGKLDTGALPTPAAPAPAPTSPSTAAEEMVASVWAEVLDTPAVDVHADFFDLGGHSLLAGRVTARLADALDLDLPIHVLFAHPTVAGLAAEVERLLIARLDQLSDDEAAELLTAPER
ncbi:amino acid adenylation domain-containing protein [Micromonospora sp. NPDC007271]|uniref:non-ribosomal peptide synthetase n=1 Tax=Micromonospora sp. NPDC007271 TaxID=3154587 RepID=UPI0033E905D8